MHSLRIVFMGTAEFAVPSLHALAASPHVVAGVVTAPDAPRGRGQKPSFTPVKQCAVQYRLPVLHPGMDKDALREPAFLEALRDFRADLFLVVAFRILPAAVFEIPPRGCVNLHASLLPRFRGAAPIPWAIIRGAAETGVTTFFIQQKVDTGHIILQRSTPIGEDETAGELYDRLSMLGAETLLETTHAIAGGRVTTTAQDETLASDAPKIFRENCRIDWTKPAGALRNFVRGLTPSPGAFTELHGASFKIHRIAVRPGPFRAGPPGTVIQAGQEGGLWVRTGADEAVEILEIQPASKKRMTAAEFLRGHLVRTGQQFV